MAAVVFASLVVAAAALAYVWYRIIFRERLALADQFPCPPFYPIIGHCYLLRSSMADFFKVVVDRVKDFPEKICMVRFWHVIAIAVWSAEDTEVILSSSKHINKSSQYRFFQPWLGNGLLISSGEKWRTHRRMIAPTFHANVLKQFVYLFNRNSVALCERFSTVAGKTIDAHDFLSESTVEILLETAMGVDRKTQTNGYNYAMAVMKLCDIIHNRQFRPWLWTDTIFSMLPAGRVQSGLIDTVHNLTKQVLKMRRAERLSGVREGLYKRVGTRQEDADTAVAPSDLSSGQAGGLRDDLDEDVGEKKRSAFLDQMLDVAEDGSALSDQEVEDQVNTIMFEGHDTTAAASSFFLSVMGVRQDVQERCVAELRDIFGESSRPATFQDTLEMKYLERCILETLRLYTPVPIVAREVTENVPLKSGLVIPKGTTVVVAPFQLHRDPEAFPNPLEFNPDNFLAERSAKRHHYAFIPFSAGPRSCVGRKYAMLKLKILLSTVLRRYHIRADVLEKDFRFSGDIILKRTEGHPVRLYPRAEEKAIRDL